MNLNDFVFFFGAFIGLILITIVQKQQEMNNKMPAAVPDEDVCVWYPGITCRELHIADRLVLECKDDDGKYGGITCRELHIADRLVLECRDDDGKYGPIRYVRGNPQ